MSVVPGVDLSQKPCSVAQLNGAMFWQYDLVNVTAAQPVLDAFAGGYSEKSPLLVGRPRRFP